MVHFKILENYMFRNYIRFSLCLVLILKISFVSGNNSDNSVGLPEFIKDTSNWVDSVFNSLTLEERVAQLIIAPAYPEKDCEEFNKLCETVLKHDIGGIIFFKGGAVKVANMSNRLQQLAKTPLLMSVDGEWGLAMRIDSTMIYPKQIMLGAIDSNKLIYNMGADIAMQLKRMGLQSNYAPVVDINNNPANPVINSRSFGQDKNKVIEKSNAYMYGLKDNRIITVAKHFPGHGDTDNDSHSSLPVLPFSYNRLDSVELVPFKSMISNGVDGIMVAHLDIPALDSSKTPATLSSKVVNGLLKDSLKFKGLIFTDALTMKGVTVCGSQKEIAIDALKAGNDILLMPDDIPIVLKAIVKAVKTGIIKKEDINNKCRKVLLAKYWAGLNNYKPIVLDNLYNDLNKSSYNYNRRKLVEAGLTVLKNENDFLPLKDLDTLKIASLSIGTCDTTVFQKTIDLYAKNDKFCINKNIKEEDFDSLINTLKGYNLIIAGVLNTDMRFTKKFGVTESSIAFLKKLADTTNVILDIFASPYVLDRFYPTNKFKAVIMSYEDKETNQDLSAQLIFGGIVPKGTLPVTASAEYSYGSGLKWDQTIRLKYTQPEELGLDPDELNPIDSIVRDGIEKKALPGCVILFAKEGKVFYQKAFGNFRYDSVHPVQIDDVYDLASVTKVIATIPALMQLYDNKVFSIDDKLVKLLPDLKKTNKKKIIIKDVLTHQARLLPYSAFYLKTIECQNPGEKLISRNPQKEAYKVDDGSYINCSTRYLPGIYSSSYSKEYPIHVADSLYIKTAWTDSIFKYIYNSPLYPNTVYKYSDFGFILFSKAVVNYTGQPFDEYLYKTIYKPLGAENLCFKPLAKINKNKIAPTEDDIVFRKQVLTGYVHDPTAAMLGCVSGHAGLFSDANDLCKLLQMYLNKGVYGGKTYFKEGTVDLFTSRPYTNNRRALGFDKPEPNPLKISPVSRMVSDSSYGHTGYTGTMIWVDPVNKLIFIFLSNRVYPNAAENKLAEMNIRTKIQDVMYKALIKNTNK